MVSEHSEPKDGQWQLEGLLGQGKTWAIPVEPIPFSIGRHSRCHLNLESDGVSRAHAEIAASDGQLWIRDLGSTNGTFLNHGRLDNPAPLKSGDIVHFGSLEFRISCRQHQEPTAAARSTGIYAIDAELPEQFVNCVSEFNELLNDRAVIPVYQPIVELHGGHIIAYEMLGRGNHPALPIAPLGLFDIAERLGKEIELSCLFRQVGVESAMRIIGPTRLFFNNHPAETNSKEMERSLREVREVSPSIPLVLEVHEKSVTDSRVMRNLRDLLTDLGMGLAYDDFGAGQARLLELIQVPPDVLKFDAVLVRDIHQQPVKFQQVLQTLIMMAKDLGVDTLAEGVETREEAEVCTMMGFDTAQGFYYGRPLENPPPTSVEDRSGAERALLRGSGIDFAHVKPR
jgi:EAL domain-containing protein (putative c-di-GMP-specific phosphodiesterase class I)